MRLLTRVARAEEVEAQESDHRREHEARDGETLATGVHRFRLQARVAVLLGEIGVERFRRRVQQISRESADGTIGNDVFVHIIHAPACVTAIEQPQVPVRVPLAVCKPAAEEAIAARYCISVVLRGLHRAADASGELG